MRNQTLGRVATAALLLSLPLSAQLTIRGDPIQQLQSKAGRTIKGELAIENSTSRIQGGRLKIEGVKNDRSMHKWIKIIDPYFNIPAKSIVRIKYRVSVPKDVNGSFWAKFVLSPAALQKMGMVKIRTQLAGYIILDIPGGRTGIEFLDMKYEDGKFLIDARNSGTVEMRPVLTLYADSQPYAAKKRLCFPG